MASVLTVMTVLWTVFTEMKGQSCGPKVSARLLTEIPCDMRTNAYCEAPGTAYPWHAVRRFIYDHQGLVRRMYGDERHSVVLLNERSGRRLRYDVSWSPRTGTGRSASRLRPRARPSSVSKILSTAATENVTDDTTTITTEFEVEAVTNVSLDTETNTVTGNTALTTDTDIVTTTDSTTPLIEELEKKEGVIEEPTSNAINLETDSTSQGHVEQEPERGVSACPVKEEVVAPYWANNTRGETLALLNVYPFEQYIHSEKCSFEGEQMLCRKGCRCEQQYRLHRLLAFDPKNECRGIFSDWFRFPSCCVCICYSIPLEPDDEEALYRG